ncbi:MAG: class I SAM-dependent methyltransferase [Magnetococcales bacterium]|nr:class I SAM-dependent methyltransferase [Magnetococcales bacterium]MBF0115707.1 class I SAM-dependent methyltransferase [Magnetococcales bacterium]
MTSISKQITRLLHEGIPSAAIHGHLQQRLGVEESVVNTFFSIFELAIHLLRTGIFPGQIIEILMKRGVPQALAGEIVGDNLVYSRILYTACPLCNLASPHPVLRGIQHQRAFVPQASPFLPPTMTWLCCRGCGHVFTDGYHQPIVQQIVFRFEQLEPVVDIKYLEAMHILAGDRVNQVGQYRSSGRWLDVGFGNGALLHAARECGYEPTGIDLQRKRVVELQQQGIEAHCCRLDELALPDGQCAVVSMTDVLEHIPFPTRYLLAAHRLLQEDGVLLLSLPNRESRIWQLLDAQNNNPFWHQIDHYHNFGRTRLYQLLQEYGFQPLNCRISQRTRMGIEVVAGVRK